MTATALADTLLTDFKRESEITRRILEQVPEDEQDMAKEEFNPVAAEDRRELLAIFDLPRTVCLRDFILSHITHHRAQLGVYLRMLDVPLSGTYGPTADTQGGGV